MKSEFYIERIFMASTNTELFEFYKITINNSDFLDFLERYGIVKELLIYDIIDINIELRDSFYYIIRTSIKNQEAFDRYFSEELQLPQELFDDELRKELLEDQINFVSNALLFWERLIFGKDE